MRFLDKTVSGKVYYLVLFLVAFVFTLLFSFSASPIYLHWGDDCTAYEQMGRLILHGGTPYIDIFDHKGLLLYLINALGLLINQHWGIFALQVLFLFATLLIWDKILVELQLGEYDRLVARHLTEYGFRYKNETQHLNNIMIVYGTGVFGHAFCPDERYEVSLHYNAASWLDNPKKKSRFRALFRKMSVMKLVK